MEFEEKEIKQYFVVTIKYRQEGVKHNPRDKKLGRCIVSESCTDMTGNHHSILVNADDKEEAKSLTIKKYGEIHITRIESVREILGDD